MVDLERVLQTVAEVPPPPLRTNHSPKLRRQKMHSSLVCVRACACACVRSCVRACEFLGVFVHACVCLCLCASTSIRSAFGLRSRRFVQCDNSEIAEGTSAVVGNPYHLWPTACHALPGRREAQQSERRERSEPPLHRHRRRVCKLGYCANRCDRWKCMAHVA
jgi:hypothetical protein